VFYVPVVLNTNACVMSAYCIAITYSSVMSACGISAYICILFWDSGELKLISNKH